MHINRRTFLATAALGSAGLGAARETTLPESIRQLQPMTSGIEPISLAERQARLGKAQRLMEQNKLDAVLMERGTSVFYYSAARPKTSSGPFALILRAQGEPVWVVSAADRDAIGPGLKISGDVRTYKTKDDAYATLAAVVKEGKSSHRQLGLEEQVPFSTFSRLSQQLSGYKLISATPVTAGCRMIKSPAEIALMQRASDVTIAAYRAALSALTEGMTQYQLSDNIAAAYGKLGFPGDAMVNLGKSSAYPHGSIKPQQLREGDVVLVDDGCTVEGYQSDITRTVVFGKPTQRERDVWDLEHRAQDAAFRAAQVGATCESVDAAARKVITDAGFGPGYKLPGLPHRTGHGIGLDGHEWTYFVKGNQTRIAPGMCFSDEPMIAIYGEFGVRLEDCLYITESGPRFFSKPSHSLDQPFG